MTNQTDQENIPQEPLAVLKKRKEHIQNQLRSFQFVWWGWLLACLVGGVIIFSMTSFLRQKEPISVYEYIPRILLGAVSGCFIYGYVVFLMRMMLTNRGRRIDYELVQAGSEELQEKIEENFFTKLVQINFKYIDQYYLQTQEQADKSFRLSSFASVAGLVIVIIGIIMMYYGRTQPAYVTTASGLISELIAAIFFYLYNRTILKMSQYHQKLVLTQNISLALKITDDMQAEAKTKALELIIDRLTLDVNKYLTDSKT